MTDPVFIREFYAGASPDFRAWLDANVDRIEPWLLLMHALQGRAVLPVGSGYKITGEDPIGAWWPSALTQTGLPATVAEQVIAPLAARIAAKTGTATDIPIPLRNAAAARVLAIVATRDRAASNDWLHASNKFSREVFKRVTGHAKPDSWFASVGYDLEAEQRAAEAARAERAAREAADRRAKQSAAAQAKIDEKLSQRVRYQVDGREHIGTVREMIDDRIRRGARNIQPSRDGMAIRWWIWNDDTGVGTMLGGTVERDYAANELERVTGVYPTLITLPPIVSYRRDWRRLAAEVVADESKARTAASTIKSIPRGMDTKKAAVQTLDHWFKTMGPGQVVQELAVVEDTHHGDKVYFPIIVYAPANP